MADIQEIPIESTVGGTNSEQAAEQTVLSTQVPPETAEEPPKRGRGRPAGAKNKAKPKAAPPAPTTPPAKPKPRPKKKPVEYEESEESEEEKAPAPRRRAQQAPAELDRHALASDVLSILQQQRFQRSNARRDHYASWFQ